MLEGGACTWLEEVAEMEETGEEAAIVEGEGGGVGEAMEDGVWVELVARTSIS